MNSVEEIYAEVNKCRKCSLYKNRNIDCIFRGSEIASIMGIGEAFGANEQRYGKPFIGRSGKLLDLLLLESGILPEKDIYITNVVKDRPVGTDGKDRKPFFDEIKACEEYILKEIEILNPKLIITLGKTSGDWFNKYETYNINHFYKEKKWLPLYHPSYLLRSRSEIPKFVEAIKNTLKEI